MAGFLYYLPGEKQQPSLEKLSEKGIGYAFDTPPFHMPLQGNGPGGNRVGVLVGCQDRMGEHSIRYLPNEQEWIELPAGVWLGWYRNAKPTPADLARDQQLPGYDLTMADGNQWTIPLVRNVDDCGEPVCMLPAVLVRDKHSRSLVPGPPIERYRYLWDATEWAWTAMVSEEDIAEEKAEEAVGMLYGANYYVGVEELLALGLYSTQLRPLGLLALSISYTRWQAWSDAKKKELSHSGAGGLISSDGEAA